MNFLIDTCVISELAKPNPQTEVIDHLESIANHRLFLSVLTVGELAKGIAKLPESKRKSALTSWLDNQLMSQFRDRMVVFDERCARRWGQMQGEALANGIVLPVIDAMIATTAQVYDLMVITRNTKDFERCGVSVLNPWPN